MQHLENKEPFCTEGTHFETCSPIAEAGATVQTVLSIQLSWIPRAALTEQSYLQGVAKDFSGLLIHFSQHHTEASRQRKNDSFCIIISRTILKRRKMCFPSPLVTFYFQLNAILLLTNYSF